MSLIRIREVMPQEGFHLLLRLTDGTAVERDVRALTAGPVFELIRSDPGRFREVRVEDGALVWPNGADLCLGVVIWGDRRRNPSIGGCAPGLYWT